jgi:hypothetical protein
LTLTNSKNTSMYVMLLLPQSISCSFFFIFLIFNFL